MSIRHSPSGYFPLKVGVRCLGALVKPEGLCTNTPGLSKNRDILDSKRVGLPEFESGSRTPKARRMDQSTPQTLARARVRRPYA